MKKLLGVLLGTVVVAAVCAMAPTAALAYSSGTFTKAVATEDWSHGSFNGTITWADCNINCASWLAVAVVQPTIYPCSATSWQEISDPNIEQVWSSGGQHGNFTLPFEVNGARLIPGIYGQRICLDGIQSYTDYPQEQPMQQLLATTVLQVETPPPATPLPPAPPPLAPAASSAICLQGAAAVEQAWAKVAQAKTGFHRAKRSARPKSAKRRRAAIRLKREVWEQVKKQAQQTERQQHELCG